MKKILIIDDDQEFGTAISSALRRSGYETRVAFGGNVGLKFFKEQPVDLVISDILMPEGDGVETILAFRKIDPTLPIIAMSGGGLISPKMYHGIVQACGVKCFLNKPFELTRLIELVNQLLAAVEQVEDATREA